MAVRFCSILISMVAVLNCFKLFGQITPGNLVNITRDGSVGSIVIVARAQDEFMASWVSTSGVPFAGISNDLGKGWILDNLGDVDVTSTWVAGNDDRFVVSYQKSPTANLGNVYARSSPYHRNVWTSSRLLGGGDVAEPLVGACANQLGFVVSWWGFTGEASYVNFSTDGITWNGAEEISINRDTNTPVMVAASNSGFMAAWQELNGLNVNGYVSYSADGITWGTPQLVSGMTNLRGGNVITIGATDAGFMLAWVDALQVIYTSFSRDQGATWTSPVILSRNLTSQCESPIVSLAGNSTDFIASWVGYSGEALASLSSNNGETWEEPVILNRGANIATNGSEYSTVGVSVFNSNAMFTWQDSDSNAISCYASLYLQPVRNLSGSRVLNQFFSLAEYVNVVSWSSSLSDITGYAIYRNGECIALVPPSQLTYEDHDQSGSVTYEVVAVNGIYESSPESITL